MEHHTEDSMGQISLFPTGIVRKNKEMEGEIYTLNET